MFLATDVKKLQKFLFIISERYKA